MARRKNILIVDDNLVNRKVLAEIVQRDGYNILQAENGQQALDILLDEQKHVDLVLLDIVMPVMDGHQLLQKMREMDLSASVPVIVMTGSEQTEMEIKCLQEGASDFLRKPYNEQLIRHRIESMLRLWNNALLVSKLEIDRLTGVYNTESFYARAEEKLIAEPHSNWAVIYLTVEDFDIQKTRYGQDTMDGLMHFLGGLVQNWPGEYHLSGRMGQESFVVLHKNLKLVSQETLGQLFAQYLQNSIYKGVNIKSGVCIVNNPDLDIHELVHRAQLAESTIEHKYGQYAAYYDDSMRQAALREHQLTNYMEEALEQHQFVVYLQPKHNTATGAIAGAEALVRWIHPELGFISPGEFIPLFERNGFISKLDYFVWEETCRTLHGWLEQGFQPVPISVNASRADFLAADLPERVADLIEKYAIPPELLHVEVTESAYTDNPDQIINAVSVMRDMGFKIEMDDFGSGYSSLNMLSELPIDMLKLDMRFMQQGTDRLKGSKRNILSFIVSMSKWLQLPTIAEGVETKEEVELLKSMGCDYIQGYYFSKPMSIDNFEMYMRNYVNTLQVDEATKYEEYTAVQVVAEADKRKVLVVEDIPSNREVMKALLSSEYKIATAENGQLAYDYLCKHYSELDCILLDLLMPVMDGFQLLELIHKDEKLSQVPVIITTETGKNSELRALNLGAHSFVAKPYDADVLRHHVHKAIEEKRLREENKLLRQELAAKAKA